MKTEAESLATLIEMGFSPATHAVQWADELIANTPGPANASLCDISMVGVNAHSQDVVHLLRSIPGSANLKEVALAVVRRAKDLLQESASNSRTVANGLRNLAIEDSLPLGSVCSDIWWFDEALDLSESQIIPDSQERLAAGMIEALNTRIVELRDEQSGECEAE